MIPFYCVHHKPAIERKEYLKNFPFDINWIESYPPDHKDVKNQTSVLSPHASNGECLNSAEISCFLKHREVIKNITLSKSGGIIIEDDIEIPDFPDKIFDFFVNEFERQEIDIAFIGSFTGADLDLYYNEPIVLVNENFKSRCAHCYFVSKSCAGKLAPYLQKIIAPFDWQLNYAINDLSLKTAWTFPHVNQRTEKGKTKSLLR